MILIKYIKGIFIAGFFGISLMGVNVVYAKTYVAIMPFELNDVTQVGDKAELLEQTASLKTELVKFLKAERETFTSIFIEDEEYKASNPQHGHLYSNLSASRKLGALLEADYVLVGQHKKRTTSASRLLVKLVSMEEAAVIAEYEVNVSDGSKKSFLEAVEHLGEQILDDIDIQRADAGLIDDDEDDGC